MFNQVDRSYCEMNPSEISGIHILAASTTCAKFNSILININHMKMSMGAVDIISMKIKIFLNVSMHLLVSISWL